MKTPGMNRSAAFFLQAAIVFLGTVTLGLMLLEPHFEGRNAHATTFEIYFSDPFLAYVYAGSIPYFVALHRAFGLFGHVRRTGSFSPVTLDALRSIKRCAIALVGFVVGAAVFIVVFGEGEPGGVFMCALAVLGASAMGAVAAIAARILQAALLRAEGRQP